jgi:hypothetical protein
MSGEHEDLVVLGERDGLAFRRVEDDATTERTVGVLPTVATVPHANVAPPSCGSDDIGIGLLRSGGDVA